METLFIPPPDLGLKVGSARYNDGGLVKRDFERPERSFESGFLYQQFNPKPLGTREVWLPDKSTKINNSFWMIIGRQFLSHTSLYPCKDPLETYANIKERLYKPFSSFDISGFGFQYIREWLFIVAEEIAVLYPNPDLEENITIFKNLFKNPKVQLEDGSFVYPPRGTGLGYYEDLKTIGVMSILHPFNPISVYGDQGILDRNTVIPAVQSLRSFGFELPSKKVVFDQTEIKWSGWTMSYSRCVRSKALLEPLISLFSRQYHWERKMILRSYCEQYPEYYKSKESIIPFFYENIFGFEFFKTDSLLHFDNTGVSSIAHLRTGDLRTWSVQRLKSPADKISDGFLYESPFFTQWKRSDAKEFSILRKNLYRNSRIGNTAIYDYAHPVIELNKTRKPDLPKLAGLISDDMESKLVINHQMTTGKFLFGLSGNGAKKALDLCIRARNPWEAYATGGYRVKTVWRGDPRIPYEAQFLLDHFLLNIDMMNSYIYTKLDIDSFNYASMFPHSRPNKRESMKDVPRNLENINKRVKNSNHSYSKISLDQMFNLNYDNGGRDDSIVAKPVSSLLTDINERMTGHFSEEAEITYDDDDVNLFLEEFS